MIHPVVTTFDWVQEGPRSFVRDLRLRWACEEDGLCCSVQTVPLENRGPKHVAYLFESGACPLKADVLRVDKIRAFGDRPATEAYVACVTARPAFARAHADQMGHLCSGGGRTATDGRESFGMTGTVMVNVSIDVPDLASGLRFYERVVGFRETALPFPTMAVLDADNTPVHLDMHVAVLDPILALVRQEGGWIEREFHSEGWIPVAFCCDSFGHGICVIAASLSKIQDGE